MRNYDFNQRRSFWEYLGDNILWVIAVAVLAFFGWLITEFKQSFYEYRVKVVFCDSRPPREVTLRGFSCPGIDYQEGGRYSAQALSAFKYVTPNNEERTLLNVCEVQVLHKTYLGEYSLSNQP